MYLFVDDENLDHVEEVCDKIGEYVCICKIPQTTIFILFTSVF